MRLLKTPHIQYLAVNMLNITGKPYNNCYKVYEKVLNVICIQAFRLHNNLCEFTALDHKFKRLFCTQKLVLNVPFEDFWYTKINPTFIWYLHSPKQI